MLGNMGLLHALEDRHAEAASRFREALAIQREIGDRLRFFCHPLRGGKDGRGWPFGRNVFKVDLYHVVEEVEGVDFVSKIRIYDEDKKVEVEQIRVMEDELPYLVNVEITEKAHEKIV